MCTRSTFSWLFQLTIYIAEFVLHFCERATVFVCVSYRFVRVGFVYVSFCWNIFLIFVSHFIHYFCDAIGKKYSIAVRIAVVVAVLDNFQNIHWVLFTSYTISSMVLPLLVPLSSVLLLYYPSQLNAWCWQRHRKEQTKANSNCFLRYVSTKRQALARTSNLLSNFLLSLCMYDKRCHCICVCVCVCWLRLHVVDFMRFHC